MPQGKCACDRVAQSDSSVSRHIPKLCLSLTDSVDNVSYMKCTRKPASVSVKDRNPFVSTIYCLHNTGFGFVTDWLLGKPAFARAPKTTI